MRATALFTVTLSMALSLSAAAAEEAAPDAPLAALSRADTGRFRFGINGAAGLESVAGVSGPMFGLDLRLGWQVNDLLALYAQPHLSFGSLSASSAGATISGATGTFAGSVLAEATFMDRFFAGAGVGYGVLNNPSGFTFEARAGGYPLASRSDDGSGRGGLMLGVDLKTVFISGATGILVTGCVGYEAF